MDQSEPVKVNASANVQVSSKDLPGIIKAFESMETEKVKILCATAVAISLIVMTAITVSVAFIAL